MKRLLAPLAMLGLALAGCSAPADSTPAVTPQSYEDVAGSVRLPPQDGITKYQVVNDPETGKSTRCYPMKGSSYRDLHSDGTAKIISSRGDVVVGKIDVGDWDGTRCTMRLSFSHVPSGFAPYSLFLGHRSEIKVSDISAPLELSIGD